jgi:hypothetical protein
LTNRRRRNRRELDPPRNYSSMAEEGQKGAAGIAPFKSTSIVTHVF